MPKKDSVGNDIRWICPLYGFVCLAQNLERITLDHGCALFRIPDELREHLNANWPAIQLDAHDAAWAIEVTEIAKADQRVQLGKTTFGSEILDQWFRGRAYVEGLVADIITAIRLQHRGKVTLGPLVIQLSNPPDEPAEFMYSTYVTKPRDLFVVVARHYELRKDEIDHLREFWLAFRDKRKSGKLRDLEIAIDRFNSSYLAYLGAILIDQMTALESLYLGDDKELGYKLAMRAAFLLANGKRERNRVFERLRDAYNARSRIIHGAEAPDNLGELIGDTEEYLRQSIRRVIELSDDYTSKQLRERVFDQNIIEAGSLLTTE